MIAAGARRFQSCRTVLPPGDGAVGVFLHVARSHATAEPEPKSAPPTDNFSTLWAASEEGLAVSHASVSGLLSSTALHLNDSSSHASCDTSTFYSGSTSFPSGVGLHRHSTEEETCQNGISALEQIVMYAYSFILPEMSELLPHLHRARFVDERISALRDGSWRTPVCRNISQTREEMRTALLVATEEFVMQECCNWPSYVIVTALRAFVDARYGTKEIFCSLLACRQLELHEIISFLEKHSGSWDIANKECRHRVFSCCQQAVQQGDLERAVLALSSLAADGGDTELLAFDLLLSLLRREVELTEAAFLEVLSVLEIGAKSDREVPADAKAELAAAVRVFVTSVEEMQELSLKTCSLALSYLNGLAGASAEGSWLKVQAFRPLSVKILWCLYGMQEQPTTHTLCKMLRLLKEVRLKEQPILQWIINHLLAMPAFTFNPALMVDASYNLALLCSNSQGLPASILQRYSSLLSIERLVMLVLASAMSSDFLIDGWWLLVCKVNERESRVAGASSNSWWPFLASSILIMHKLARLEVPADSIQLSNESLAVLAECAATRSYFWQRGSLEFNATLVGTVGECMLWRQDPLTTNIGIRCLAVVVMNQSGDFVARDREFDAGAMVPVYFVQGAMDSSGQLDGFQRLLFQIHHRQNAFWIHVQHGTDLVTGGEVDAGLKQAAEFATSHFALHVEDDIGSALEEQCEEDGSDQHRLSSSA